MSTTTATAQEKQHAMLSPSSSSAWLNCTPSAAMCALMPKEDTVYTKNGTDAHTLAERKVRKLIEGRVYDDITVGLESFDEEMDECTDEYVNFVASIVSKAMEDGFIPNVRVETIMDLSAFIPEGKGTADLIVTAGDTLHVVDFKYGANKSVDAHMNTQMRIYAAGAQEKLREECGQFANIRMTIFQPRMGNVSTDEISGQELSEWVESTLKPKAELAFKGLGELVEGNWCDFCSARLLCRKKREEQVKALERLVLFMEDYKEEAELIGKDKTMDKEAKAAAKKNLLTNEEIATVIKLGQGIPYWLGQINDYALARALGGETFKGFKLIADVTPSKLTETAVPTIEKLGIDPYKPRELKSKSVIEKEVGKKIYGSTILPLLVPGEEKAKLVDVDDKAEAKPYTYFTPDGRKRVEEKEKSEENSEEKSEADSASKTEN